MEDALAALAAAKVHNPLAAGYPRAGARGPPRPHGRAGARARTPYYALKEVCVFPENPKRGLDTHLGAVILHSGETGEPLAIMNASAITAIRTAAVSAVATKLLAREDSAVLAIIARACRRRAIAGDPARPRPVRDDLSSADRGQTSEGRVRGPDIIVTATSIARAGPEARVDRARARTSTPSARASPPRASSTSRPSRVVALRRSPRVDGQRVRRLPRRAARGRHRGPSTSARSSASF
jgi:hypothetical protein